MLIVFSVIASISWFVTIVCALGVRAGITSQNVAFAVFLFGVLGTGSCAAAATSGFATQRMPA